MSLLEGYAANLLQDSQVVTYRLDTQAFLYHHILLKFPDELLVELAESKVGNFEPAADEISETAAGNRGNWEVYGGTHRYLHVP